MRTARGGPNWRAAVLACLAVACGLAACDRPAPVGPSESAVRASRARGFVSEVAMEVKAVATLLAEGLGAPEARAALHKAMRESPLTHHAIVLTEFVETPEGRRVLREVTDRTGVAEADLRQRVGSLPPLQLYLPNRAQRRSWRAAESVAVVALTDEVSPLEARVAGGGRIALPRNSRTPATTTAVLVLGPREAFLTRRDAGRPRSRTDIVEESFSGPLFDDLQCQESECSEGGGGGGSGGGGGGGGGGGSGTIVSLKADFLVTYGVCDNCTWPFDGSNEFEIKGFTASGEQPNYTIRCEGVGENDSVIISQRCAGSGDGSVLYGPVEFPAWEVVFGIWVYVQETDGWPNGDDQWRDYLLGGEGVPIITQDSPHTTNWPMWETADQFCWDSGCDARIKLWLSW